MLENLRGVLTHLPIRIDSKTSGSSMCREIPVTIKIRCRAPDSAMRHHLASA